MNKLVECSNLTSLSTVISANADYQSIILCRAVQSGKTADIKVLCEENYRDHIVILISDSRTPLREQTNLRFKGWEIRSYEGRKSISLQDLFSGFGKRILFHVMMEHTQLEALETALRFNRSDAVCLIIDEADKSRNTTPASKTKKSKKEKDVVVSEEETDDSSMDNDNDDEEVAEVNELPAITSLLLRMKNSVKKVQGGKCVFVSATPLGILTSEKDDYLVIMKSPYDNYVGIFLDHPGNFNIKGGLPLNDCLAIDRWTRNPADIRTNTWYSAVDYSVRQFINAPSKDESVHQVMLLSLEQRNMQQELLGKEVERLLGLYDLDETCKVLIFNGENKESSDTLAGLLEQKNSKKVIVIAGYCASRGVSFTDFSENFKFEIILQVHASKKSQPLNSCLQALRICGPARRTVSRPTLICNEVTETDCRCNFEESYRILKEIGENQFPIRRGGLTPGRWLTQKYNFRYLTQRKGTRRSSSWETLMTQSLWEDNLLPIK